MTQSKSILELKRKALAMGLCGDYKGKWDNAQTPKELVKLATDINGADFLCASVAKEWGLSKDFLLKNFGEYINGKFIARQEKGYTSEIYIGHTDKIVSFATILILLYTEDAVVHIPKNHVCKIYAAQNTNLVIMCEGCAELIDYTPGRPTKTRIQGDVKVSSPKEDTGSWIGFGGNENKI